MKPKIVVIILRDGFQLEDYLLKAKMSGLPFNKFLLYQNLKEIMKKTKSKLILIKILLNNASRFRRNELENFLIHEEDCENLLKIHGR